MRIALACATLRRLAFRGCVAGHRWRIGAAQDLVSRNARDEPKSIFKKGKICSKNGFPTGIDVDCCPARSVKALLVCNGKSSDDEYRGIRLFLRAKIKFISIIFLSCVLGHEQMYGFLK